MTKLNKIHSRAVERQRCTKGERCGIYWTRKQNRFERIHKENGWRQICRDVWWLLRDRHLIGSVAYYRNEGLYYAHIMGIVGNKTFTSVQKAIGWVQENQP